MPASFAWITGLKSSPIRCSTIAASTFESSQDLLKQARGMVLDKYYLFALLAKLLDRKDPAAPKKAVELRARRHFGRAMRRIMMIVRSVLPSAVRRR